MGVTPAIVWFRLDLRLADNPALAAAVARGGPVIPVFVWAPEEEQPWQPGAASILWLHHSLISLDRDLRRVGSRLLIRRGPSNAALRSLIHETGATALFWNRRYEPAVRRRDEHLEAVLHEEGLEVASFNSALLNEPWNVKNKSGRPFQVFTPFWNCCLSLPEPAEPIAAPRALVKPSKWPAGLQVEDLSLLPRVDWAGGIRETWRPGASEAQEQLKKFIGSILSDYETSRDLPAEQGTSRLSPHLHFGELSPRQVWHAIRASVPGKSFKSSRFLAELGWREFSHHLLYHFPEMPSEPLRKEFAKFHWRRDERWIAAWQRGQTGYPVVDAGMRELWTTGWMHNRVRMVAASFLVKHLLVSWREGTRWFWDTLVDADLAQNSMGWQWVAGCGADAAPFFRIFNPVLQGEKFDPCGAYVRHWLPELGKLPNKWIHQPHKAPPAVLASAGLELGKSYPEPIINHVIAREVALEAYAAMRTRTGNSG